MNRSEYNTATGNGYISFKKDVLSIDKDWLTDLIAEEIIQLSGTELEIIKPVEVNSDIYATFTLCVEARVSRLGWLSIDFDFIGITADEEEIELKYDDLFIDQIISKYDELNN